MQEELIFFSVLVENPAEILESAKAGKRQPPSLRVLGLPLSGL